MDLSERRGELVMRHPWETARAEAIKEIVAGLGVRAPRVLDVGCGDAYVIEKLHEELKFREVVAQDINFPDEELERRASSGIQYVREVPATAGPFDLVLLLDVLEHTEPQRLLREILSNRLAPHGRITITVPAFRWLFGAHDVALGHRTRYSRDEIVNEVRAAGLEVIRSGYLFASLLLPRALQVVKELVTGGSSIASGIGAWRQPAAVTKALHLLFTAENRACMAASSFGVPVPGLSVWLTCKRSS